ncbi:MAG: hypothetical protein GXP47_00780, partial [Acidobacteria bacterium]|nr:hypothetical protein [Acidobacteriota bacterium]
MARRRTTPSGETMARAALPLAAPILTGQPWLLLPAAVSGFLTLKDEQDRARWLADFVSHLPPELAQAFPEGTVPGEALLSHVESRAAMITELVRREIRGLVIADADDGEVASQILAGDAETLAGELAGALARAGEDLTPHGLAALLIDLFEPRLEPALTESSARDIAATLARS